jgi:hypothetical protein
MNYSSIYTIHVIVKYSSGNQIEKSFTISASSCILLSLRRLILLKQLCSQFEKKDYNYTLNTIFIFSAMILREHTINSNEEMKIIFRKSSSMYKNKYVSNSLSL